MKDFRTRNLKGRPVIYTWPFLLILLVILGFFGKSAYASFSKKRNADAERNKYQERFDNLVDKKIELETRIENLNTDRGIEEELRKRFNITKDGETLIRIIDEKK